MTRFTIARVTAACLAIVAAWSFPGCEPGQLELDLKTIQASNKTYKIATAIDRNFSPIQDEKTYEAMRSLADRCRIQLNLLNMDDKAIGKSFVEGYNERTKKPRKEWSLVRKIALKECADYEARAARARQTMHMTVVLGTALDRFKADKGEYPSEVGQMAAEQPGLTWADQWGSGILYEHKGKGRNSSYTLLSPGPDGIPDNEDDIVVTSKD
ncbi:hypothetical protein ACFL1X_09565 [Candidatus Hydrogenedentota bacterium]